MSQCARRVIDQSGQIIIFHQPRFPGDKGNSLPQLPFSPQTFQVPKTEESSPI